MGMKSPFPLRAVLSRGVSIQRAFRASSWDGKEVKTPLDNSGTVADTRIHISERQSQFPAKEPFFPVDWVDVEPGTPQSVTAQRGSGDGWPGHPTWETGSSQLQAWNSRSWNQVINFGIWCKIPYRDTMNLL